MTIRVNREAVCPADDQFDLLELTLEFGAGATLEDFARKLKKTVFLHFSSTGHILVGRSLDVPLLRINGGRGALAVEYLRAADTQLAVAVADAAIDFRFERVPALPPAREDLDYRRPVWLAFSDLFLDTDTALFRESNTRTLAESPYSLDALDAILRDEVYPACSYNLAVVTGEWAGFGIDWLERRILCGGPAPRSWWRRVQRYLTLGWTIPVRLPEEWSRWRQDIIQLRAGTAQPIPEPPAPEKT